MRKDGKVPYDTLCLVGEAGGVCSGRVMVALVRSESPVDRLSEKQGPTLKKQGGLKKIRGRTL